MAGADRAPATAISNCIWSARCNRTRRERRWRCSMPSIRSTGRAWPRHWPRRSPGKQRRPLLFVEINTGAEPQKAGVQPQDADAFLAACRDRYGLTISGLMCIPPLDEAPAPHFALTAQIARRNGLALLSMGMSADFADGDRVRRDPCPRRHGDLRRASVTPLSMNHDSRLSVMRRDQCHKVVTAQGDTAGGRRVGPAGRCGRTRRCRGRRPGAACCGRFREKCRRGRRRARGGRLVHWPTAGTGDYSADPSDLRTRRRRGRSGEGAAMSAGVEGDRPATTAAPRETGRAGVPPSPSRLLALTPPRPSATGTSTAPARSQPCDRRPGRGRTSIVPKEIRRMPSRLARRRISQLTACSCILACSTSRQAAQRNRATRFAAIARTGQLGPRH